MSEDRLKEIKQFQVSGDTAWAWRWLISEVERLRIRDELFEQLRAQIKDYFGKDGGLAALQDGVERLRGRLESDQLIMTRINEDLIDAQAEQRRKLVHPEFVRWCVRVSGPGLDWKEIGSLVKTYLEDDAILAQEE